MAHLGKYHEWKNNLLSINWLMWFSIIKEIIRDNWHCHINQYTKFENI